MDKPPLQAKVRTKIFSFIWRVSFSFAGWFQCSLGSFMDFVFPFMSLFYFPFLLISILEYQSLGAINKAPNTTLVLNHSCAAAPWFSWVLRFIKTWPWALWRLSIHPIVHHYIPSTRLSKETVWPISWSSPFTHLKIPINVWVERAVWPNTITPSNPLYKKISDTFPDEESCPISL